MLFCSNFTADTDYPITTPPPQNSGRLKVEIRRPETCFMTHLLNVCAESKVCAVEHLWLQKRRRLWLCQIIAPYHESKVTGLTRKNTVIFGAQSRAFTARYPNPQPDTLVTIFFCGIAVPAASSTQVRTVRFSCLG